MLISQPCFICFEFHTIMATGFPPLPTYVDASHASSYAAARAFMAGRLFMQQAFMRMLLSSIHGCYTDDIDSQFREASLQDAMLRYMICSH